MKFPNIRKRPWKNIDFIAIGLLEVIDGSVKILSLGYLKIDTCMKYLTWSRRAVALSGGLLKR